MQKIQFAYTLSQKSINKHNQSSYEINFFIKYHEVCVISFSKLTNSLNIKNVFLYLEFWDSV
jgi:hypothetical protein